MSDSKIYVIKTFNSKKNRPGGVLRSDGSFFLKWEEGDSYGKEIGNLPKPLTNRVQYDHMDIPVNTKVFIGFFIFIHPMKYGYIGCMKNFQQYKIGNSLIGKSGKTGLIYDYSPEEKRWITKDGTFHEGIVLAIFFSGVILSYLPGLLGMIF